MMTRMITHYHGEILQELDKPRLIEIIHDLVWESEGRRQQLEALPRLELRLHERINAATGPRYVLQQRYHNTEWEDVPRDQ